MWELDVAWDGSLSSEGLTQVWGPSPDRHSEDSSRQQCRQNRISQY